jgi:hypothetical protein
MMWVQPSTLAPGGALAKWVPTIADITQVKTSSVSAASGALAANRAIAPAHLVKLGHRGSALFRESAGVTARFLMGGRASLLDYDLVDVLPRTAPRSSRAPSVGESGASSNSASAASSNGDTSDSHHHQPKYSSRPTLPQVLAARLARHHKLAGGVGPGVADAEARRRAVSAAGPLPPAVDNGNGSLSRMEPRHARIWYLGRVKWEPVVAAPGASAPTASSSSSSSSKGGKKGAAPPAPQLKKAGTVYWFEPGLDADGRFYPVLHHAALDSVEAVAPAGTYTIPFVPGQRLEARRLGGLWAVGDVLAADRHALRLHVKRPPREQDRSATKPSAVAVFPVEAAPAKGSGASSTGSSGSSRPSRSKLRIVVAGRKPAAHTHTPGQLPDPSRSASPQSQSSHSHSHSHRHIDVYSRSGSGSAGDLTTHPPVIEIVDSDHADAAKPKVMHAGASSTSTSLSAEQLNADLNGLAAAAGGNGHTGGATATAPPPAAVDRRLRAAMLLAGQHLQPLPSIAGSSTDSPEVANSHVMDDAASTGSGGRSGRANSGAASTVGGGGGGGSRPSPTASPSSNSSRRYARALSAGRSKLGGAFGMGAPSPAASAAARSVSSSPAPSQPSHSQPAAAQTKAQRKASLIAAAIATGVSEVSEDYSQHVSTSLTAPSALHPDEPAAASNGTDTQQPPPQQGSRQGSFAQGAGLQALPESDAISRFESAGSDLGTLPVPLPAGAPRWRTPTLVLGMPSNVSPKDVEVIPACFWRYLVARRGHFCSPDDPGPGPLLDGTTATAINAHAAAAAAPSGRPPPAPPSSASSFGRRRGPSFPFRRQTTEAEVPPPQKGEVSAVRDDEAIRAADARAPERRKSFWESFS